MKLVVSIISTLVTFLATGPFSRADDRTFLGFGGIWDTTNPAPWGGIPWNNSGNDGAIFTSGGTDPFNFNPVSVAEVINVRSITINGSASTYSFSGSNLNLTSTGSSSAGPATIQISLAATTAWFRNIAGTSGLRKTGQGRLFLFDGNTFSGGLSIEGGTVKIYTDASIGHSSNAVTFAGVGGVLEVPTDFASTRPIVLNAPGTIQNSLFSPPLGGYSPIALASPLSGAGTLTLQGSAPYRLTGANDGFTGAITVLNENQFFVGSAAQLGINATAPITILNGSLTTGLRAEGSFTSGRGFSYSGSYSTIDTNGFDIGLTGTLSSSSTDLLWKIGAGTLTLGGVGAQVGSINVTVGAIRFAGTSIGAHASLVQLAAGTTAYVDASRKVTFDGAGSVVLSNGATVTFNRNSTLRGAISGDGNLAIDIVPLDSGPTFYGASTYSGTTTVTRGSVSLLGGANRLPAGTPLVMAAYADPSIPVFLSVGDTTQSVRSITGPGGRTSSGVSGVLVVGAGQTDPFTWGGQPGGNVRKEGPATWTLSGNNTLVANGFGYGTGVGLTVTGGRVDVTGVMSGNIVVGTGATLGGTGNALAPVTVHAGGRIAPGTESTIGALTLGGGSALGSVDLSAGGAMDWRLGALSTTNAGTDFDQLRYGGGVSFVLGGTSNVRLNFNKLPTIWRPDQAILAPFWQQNQTWVIADLYAGNTAQFASIENPNWGAGTFTLSLGIGPQDGDLLLNFTPVPEPASVLLVVAALGFPVLRRAVRRKMA